MDGHQDLGAARGQPRLLDQIRGVIRRLHYSIRTEQTNVDWIRRYILFHRTRHPAERGAPDGGVSDPSGRPGPPRLRTRR
jgi:hypothetical protein